MKFNCNCEWQAQPNPGQVKGYTLVTECEPCKIRREEQAAAQAEAERIKNLPENKFNSKQFFGRLIQEFSAERWFGLSKLGVGWTMQQLVDYPNFPGLKAYAKGLLMDGTITEEDAMKINTCLLEQNINLELF